MPEPVCMHAPRLISCLDVNDWINLGWSEDLKRFRNFVYFVDSEIYLIEVYIENLENERENTIDDFTSVLFFLQYVQMTPNVHNAPLLTPEKCHKLTCEYKF